MAVLLGLPVDGRIITSTGVCNRIVLYKRLFGLTPSPSELKRGNIHFKWIEKIFMKSPNDADDDILWRYKLNYDLNDI